jgi:hypothetical protein
MRDVSRFMRCTAGQQKLDEIRAAFVGKTVARIDFSNDVNAILVALAFDSGESVEVFLPELMLDALRETHGAAIQEEYWLDYPERRPKPQETSENDSE